jgi:hypothetical protein
VITRSQSRWGSHSPRCAHSMILVAMASLASFAAQDTLRARHVARQSQRPSFRVAKQAASWSWSTEPIPFCIICYAPHADSALSAADLNLGQCHTIEYRRVVTKGAHQHEAMPSRILKSKPLGKMKYDACRV